LSVEQHVFFAVTCVLAAFLFAKVEVHIEGPDGWAAKLPTWRTENVLTKIFFGGRQLTGYHLYVNLFVLAFVHMPFAIGTPWSWRAEALVWSFLILFWMIEDFLWFVVNPHFGLKNFKKEKIWWHSRAWWGIAPKEYFFMPLVAGLLYAYGRAYLG
jgi:hypothetical protein